MSRERRLARLEQRRDLTERDPSPQLSRRALDAVEEGVASLEQYALVHPDEVASAQADLVAMAPACAARERLGSWAVPPARVVGFPPGEDLPGQLVASLDCLVWRATLSREGTLAFGRYGRGAAVQVGASLRASCAILVLALGRDGRAVALRQQLWVFREQNWVLSERAAGESRLAGMPVGEADLFFGLGRQIRRGVSDGSVATLPSTEGADDEQVVAYADIAALIGRLADEPSSTVEFGQGRSDLLRQQDVQ